MNDLKPTRWSSSEGKEQVQHRVSGFIEVDTHRMHIETSAPFDTGPQTPAFNSGAGRVDNPPLDNFRSSHTGTASISSSESEFTEEDCNCSFGYLHPSADIGERHEFLESISENAEVGGAALNLGGASFDASSENDDLGPEFPNEQIIAKACNECHEFPLTSNQLNLSRLKVRCLSL
jgi:hypothetical protein